ncbi:synaptic vesicle membrane protein VAT-1 homolog-like [Penaeus monodon]|uniref:synaptic vesicle membrane protein VAT-1 homolog-like n=1 Tax=Penaeus monodon TaxID=6687 RepID=UPI0018A7A748|nr:synaptic vesicle membrane protein VAT-1 homolog-like [Penaeus monodon]
MSQNVEGKTTQNKDDKPETEKEDKKEIRAAVLHSFGGLKGVKIVKRNIPVLADKEILINVKLCGVNFHDVITRLGLCDAPPIKTPFILGSECAGVVEGVAEGVAEFQVGDRVVALPDARAWADVVPAASKYVYLVPETMPLQEAAAITLTYSIAYMLVHNIANVRPGNIILLYSAGGAVGQAICSLVKAIGDVTVVGVASKGKQEQIKNSLTHFVDRTSDISAEVKKLCPGGVDVVLDCVGGAEGREGSIRPPQAYGKIRAVW